MANRNNSRLRWVLIGVALSACSSHQIKFVHPQNGATAECSASGFGLGASLSEGLASGCGRAYEERGYMPVDRLSPEQRADLERRGLMPKNERSE